MASEPLCRYCLAQGWVIAATVLDHVLALSLGGTNDSANLAPACERCNSTKGKLEQRYLDRGYDPAFVRFDPELSEWFRLAVPITRHLPDA